MLEDGYKWLSAERLKDILAGIPSDSRVLVNRVGNLLVLNANGENIGYIDFLMEGKFVDYRAIGEE